MVQSGSAWHAPADVVLTIALKRLRVSVVTGRWLVLVALLATTVGGALGGALHEYERQLASYRAQEAIAIDQVQSSLVYRQVRLRVSRPPERLGILALGLGGQQGTNAQIRGEFGPTVIGSGEKGNPLLAAYGTFDVATFLALVGSLLGVLVTCDSIVGEKETGTLAVTLTQPIPRVVLVLGEYLGAMVSVGLPVLLCWLAVLVAFAVRRDVGLTGDTVAAITMMAGLSLALVSAFSLLGLAISSSVTESATATVVALLCWVSAAVVAPSAGAWLADAAVPAPYVVDAAATSILEQVRPGAEDEALDVSHEDAIRQRLNQAALTGRLAAATPLTAFSAAASTLAMTDVEAYRRFLRRVRGFDAQLRAWQADRRRRDPARMSTYVAGEPPLDLDSLPQAAWKAEPLSSRTRDAAWFIASLTVWNVLLGLWSVHATERCDPRTR